jgi:hypothetical protein
MTRFFFDYRTKDLTLYDYRGDVFQRPQSAIEFAQATAQLLTNSLSGDWVGWSIEVRNVEGKRFVSLPIGNFPQTIS